MQTTIVPFHPDHSDALFDALQDNRIYTYIDDAPPTDRERWRARTRALHAHFGACIAPATGERWWNWAVLRDSQVVGTVQATGYTQLRDGCCDAEIAYLLHPAVWGCGVGFAACTQMLDFLREEAGITRVWTTVRYTNAPSIALALRLGLNFTDARRYPYDNYAPDDLVLSRAF